VAEGPSLTQLRRSPRQMEAMRPWRRRAKRKLESAIESEGVRPGIPTFVHDVGT